MEVLGNGVALLKSYIAENERSAEKVKAQLEERRGQVIRLEVAMDGAPAPRYCALLHTLLKMVGLHEHCEHMLRAERGSHAQHQCLCSCCALVSNRHVCYCRQLEQISARLLEEVRSTLSLDAPPVGILEDIHSLESLLEKGIEVGSGSLGTLNTYLKWLLPQSFMKWGKEFEVVFKDLLAVGWQPV